MGARSRPRRRRPSSRRCSTASRSWPCGSIREEFNADYRGVVIDDRQLYEELRDYIGAFNPELADRVEYYDREAEGLSLFEEYHVHEQVHKALDRKVWLPSGGSLIIEHTEALTVIDVNTGKNVGTSSLEQTVFHNNLEAAEEIAKQLRLRDIGGIIVIDFIDMEHRDNRAKVVETFRAALARDKTRSQVFDISDLGLVEMTRKRIGEGLLTEFSEICPNCEGRGVIVDHALLTEAQALISRGMLQAHAKPPSSGGRESWPSSTPHEGDHVHDRCRHHRLPVDPPLPPPRWPARSATRRRAGRPGRPGSGSPPWPATGHGYTARGPCTTTASRTTSSTRPSSSGHPWRPSTSGGSRPIHHALDELMDEGRAGDGGSSRAASSHRPPPCSRRLDDVMWAHLAYEDADLVPSVRRSTSSTTSTRRWPRPPAKSLRAQAGPVHGAVRRLVGRPTTVHEQMLGNAAAAVPASCTA